MKLIITQANLTLKGGAERVVLKIAQHYDAKVYTAEYDPKKTFEGFADVDVETIGKSGISKILPYGRASQGLNYGLSFYNFKIKEDYDAINAHIAPGHWIRNRNERVLWYVHTPLRDVYDLYQYRLSLKKIHQKPTYMLGTRAVKLIDQSVVRKIEGLIANSKNTQSRIEKYYGRHDSTVLGGGIDYKEYSNGGDDNYFFYVSRFSPNKRQDYAIEAFAEFKKRTKRKCELVIAGAVSRDKFYYDYYLRVVEMAKRVGDVKIIADPSDLAVRKLYSNCTAALYTPINEDYGLVPLEAMASGKPIITVNEGGPKETVTNGKTGYLVNSPEEMATRMNSIFEDRNLAERIGRNGRATVIKNYSWAGFFKEFDKKLKKVAKS